MVLVEMVTWIATAKQNITIKNVLFTAMNESLMIKNEKVTLVGIQPGYCSCLSEPFKERHFM